MNEYEFLEEMALDAYMEQINNLLAPGWAMVWESLPTVGDFLGE